MNLPVLVIGAGGHGRVVADALRAAGRKVLGFLDPVPGLKGTCIDGFEVLGDDSVLEDYAPDTVLLANGVGMIGTATTARRRVYERLMGSGFRFATVQHPSATISISAVVLPGAQAMAGSVVQPGAAIGENSILNTGALVDHDCVIGRHCHIAPGVTLSGAVRIGDDSQIGTGASVIQGITIGVGALIAAGAVVVDDVPDGARVMGVPARVKNLK